MYVSAREKVLNNFKRRLFSIKKSDTFSTPGLVPESAREPTKHTTYKLKQQQNVTNEIIADEKDINYEIFWNFFKYQNPSFLAKDLK